MFEHQLRDNQIGTGERMPPIQEVTMPEIQWRKDVDAALSEAKVARKPVLLDFSAAPM